MTGPVLAAPLLYSTFGPIGPFLALGATGLAMVVVLGAVNWWVRHQRMAADRQDAEKNTLEANPAFRRYVVAATWASGSVRDWDHSVRPVLGELVELAMAELEPTSDPREAGRERLGAQLWELVDRDARRSDDRGTPGAGHDALLRILDHVEMTEPRAHGSGAGL